MLNISSKNTKKSLLLIGRLVILGILFLAWYIFLAQPAGAVELKLASEKKEVKRDEIFDVHVLLDPQGQEINAIEGKISIPNGLIVENIDQADSLVNLWINAPTFDSKLRQVVFSGVIPGGYLGKLTPYGYIIDDNPVFNLTLRSEEDFFGPISVDFQPETTIVLLNDGLGTSAPLSFKSAEILVLDETAEEKLFFSPSHPLETVWYNKSRVKISWPVRDGSIYSYQLTKNEKDVPDMTPEVVVGSLEYTNLENGVWYFIFREKELNKEWGEPKTLKIRVDTAPPELIWLELRRDPELFEGKYHLLFHTTDKGSGLDFYQILEDGEKYSPVESPFVLRNQTLGEEIVIRALDEAGNIRELKVSLPATKISIWKFGLWVLLTLISIITIVVSVYWVYTKDRRKYGG